MLELDDLTARLGDFTLGPVSAMVEDEVLAVLGPSGSGKTTLLSLVAGVRRPDAGAVAFDGRHLVGVPPEDRQVGLVFQDGALFPHMTARENVAYAGADRDRVGELARMLEIGDVLERRPSRLSGGERQRVALARALAADPSVLLLDEPLANLDAPIRRRLRDELHDLFQSLSVPVLYVTHDRRAATVLGDRIAVLRDGELEQVGRPADVLDAPATPFVASFTGSGNVFEAEVVDRDDDGVVLAVDDLRLRATGTASSESTVTATVRSSRVRLSAPRALEEVTDGGNALSGTVHRRLNEGDAYRVTVDVDGANLRLAATVPPVGGDEAALREGARVRASIPPAAIHVID